MDALLVLELRRREVFGSMVSLDPNGFGTAGNAMHLPAIYASIRLVRLRQPVMPSLVRNAAGWTCCWLSLPHIHGRSRRMLYSTR